MTKTEDKEFENLIKDLRDLYYNPKLLSKEGVNHSLLELIETLQWNLLDR